MLEELTKNVVEKVESQCCEDLLGLSVPLVCTVEEAKAKIAQRATFAMLDYSPDDIVAESDCGYTVVWLRRYRDGYVVDEDGEAVLDEHGSPLVRYKYPMWLEFSPVSNTNVGSTSGVFSVSIPVPRLICCMPWLVILLKERSCTSV